MAEMASLELSITVYHDNIDFKWSGFNDSMPNFVQQTIEIIKQLKMEDQKEFFD